LFNDQQNIYLSTDVLQLGAMYAWRRIARS